MILEVLAIAAIILATNWGMDYRDIWNRLNGNKYPWAFNPWVFAYAFRRVEP